LCCFRRCRPATVSGRSLARSSCSHIDSRPWKTSDSNAPGPRVSPRPFVGRSCSFQLFHSQSRSLPFVVFGYKHLKVLRLFTTLVVQGSFSPFWTFRALTCLTFLTSHRKNLSPIDKSSTSRFLPWYPLCLLATFSHDGFPSWLGQEDIFYFLLQRSVRS